MTEIEGDEEFLTAPATEAVVARGDVLYIPSYWYKACIDHTNLQ
jgi:ribosomal protein L16 Arg81 hydroxylase